MNNNPSGKSWFKAKIKKALKTLANSNFLTRAIYNWRDQRHLARVVAADCKQYGTETTFRENAVEIRKGNQCMLISRKHAIYAGTLSKSFDVYFSAVVPEHENGLSIADFSKPKVHTLKNGMQFEFSTWPEEIEAIDGYFMWYKPKVGETVFDLGAHCGFSVYFFSTLVGPNGRVICFEPDPTNLEILRRNMDRYNLRNVTVVPAAIGGADGTAQFSSEGTIGSQLISLLGRESVGSVISVPVVSLKSAFEKYGFPTFCKMDIEGAEIEALSSATECLAANPVHFVVDTNHTLDGTLTDTRVEAIVKILAASCEAFQRPNSNCPL